MWVLETFLLFTLAFHTSNLKSDFMIFWKEFLLRKEKVSLLPTIFAPSGRMIGRPQRGTRSSPVESFVSLLTFLSTTFTFVLEAGYWYTNGHQKCTFVGWSLPPYLRVWFHGQNNEAGHYKSHPVQRHLSVHRRFIQYKQCDLITSAQFTGRNCSLRTLPYHLLKCVSSTRTSRQAT